MLVGYTAFNVVAAATGTEYGTVETILGPGGFALGFLGLLGLYPALADRSPKLARAGAACVTLGAVGFSTISLHGVTQLAGTEEPAWFAVSTGLAALGMLPGYVAFGVATLRTGVRSQRLGLLLLVPAVVFGVMVLGGVLAQFGYRSAAGLAWSAVLISGAQALAHLGIGYTLRAGDRGARAETPAGDATVG